MKKIVSLIISAIMLIIAINIPALAVNDNITVYLNSREIDFDQKPIIENGRTLVPMRAIFEAMNCDVEWDGEERSIIVRKEGILVLQMWIDVDIMYGSDGELIELDVPPQILHERTLVPLRAISESMGADVEWDGAARAVEISYSGYLYDKNCAHENTTETTIIDARRYINTDSSETHTVIDEIQVYCEDCHRNVKTKEREKEEAHKFKNGICTLCGYTKSSSTKTTTVKNTPEPEEICKHKNTRDIGMIDERTYKNTGSADTHIQTDKIVTVCDDCGEDIKTRYEDKEKEHTFENGTCIYCGYKQSSSGSTTVSKPSSSGSLSDYVDGAFLYITVPAGTSIEIPNTSSGTLKIQMDGVYNAMERKSNGQINSQAYNAKDKKGSISISKDSEAVVQNSGYSDLVVSIPAEYGTYYETSENVYESEPVGYGESIKIVADNSQSDSIYFTSGEYDYITYNEPKSNLLYTGLKGSTSRTISLNETMIITAKTNMDVIYCPATMSCTSSSRSAFDEIDVKSGETVRVYSSDTSKTIIYTDKSHSYDYVIYGTDGKVKSQKQGVTSESVNINKNCYIDFTNTSSSTVTIKVPSIYKSLG